jgi:hypothetical protein
MEFANHVQAETHQRLEEYLPELFEEPYFDPETGQFYVSYGSTVIEISNEQFGPEEAVVTVMAYCVQGVDFEEDLMMGLLELNHEVPFGAFSLSGSDVFFSYSLFARTLDRVNLLNAVAAVATVSDDYDDRIVAKYGGMTALERIRDTGGRRKRVARRTGSDT